MTNIGKYFYKPIDQVREDLIGTRITDIEPDGRIIYTQNEEGRTFAIDTTGKDGAVVNALTTETERLDDLIMKVDALVEKLGIDEDELYKLIYG